MFSKLSLVNGAFYIEFMFHLIIFVIFKFIKEKKANERGQLLKSALKILEHVPN